MTCIIRRRAGESLTVKPVIQIIVGFVWEVYACPMIRRILVPLDESKLSETVIPCALDFAARCAVETILVEVTPRIVGVATGVLPVTGHQMEVRHTELARTYLETQARRWSPYPVSIATPVGRLCECLCELAFEKTCDLILMASHGRDHFPRWLLGSVAEGVLRQARCPVLLLRPPGAEKSLFHKILVPSDGSDVSLEFLRDLRNFLAPGGSVTLLLSSGTSLSLPPGGMEEHYQAVETKLRQLPYPLVVLKGDPVHDILDWSQANAPDLIAMSTHGRSGFRRFWLGSVTEKIARHAPCPVLVFPHLRPLEGSGSHQVPGPEAG